MLKRHLRIRKQNFSNLRRTHLSDKDSYISDLDGDINIPGRSINENNTPRNLRSNAQQMSRSEMERQRRRESAIMYELLRLCITEKDLKNFASVEKLSHAEILAISVQKLKTAIKGSIRINHVMKDIEKLEQLSQRLNIPIRIERPTGISMDFHQKLTEMVGNLIEDTRINGQNGEHLETPRQVALESQTVLANLTKDATVMRIIEDTVKVPYDVNNNAPTEAVPNNPETMIGVRGDIFHSGEYYPESHLNLTFSNQALKSCNGDFSHNIPTGSLQIDIEIGIPLMGNAIQSSAYSDSDPVLTSIHYDNSTNMIQEFDDNFFKELFE